MSSSNLCFTVGCIKEWDICIDTSSDYKGVFDLVYKYHMLGYCIESWASSSTYILVIWAKCPNGFKLS
jgi:hypothetical protein